MLDAELTLYCDDEPDCCRLEFDTCFSGGICATLLDSGTCHMITISKEDASKLHKYLGKFLGEN